MPVVFDNEKSFEAVIGAHGISAQRYAAQLQYAAGSVEKLRRAYKDESLPFLRLPEKTEDIVLFQKTIQPYLRDAQDVVILGTGGSSLGAQALVQLADYNLPGLGTMRETPRLHFFDNLDPDTFERFLDYLPIENSLFIVVSKSGGTAETLVQTIAVLNVLKRAGLAARVAERVLGLSEPRVDGKPHPLRDLLEPFKVTFLEHDCGIGGRFSVLTNVGLLPAFIAGLDVRAIRAGAAQAVQQVLQAETPEEIPSVAGAILNLEAAHQGKNITVMMAYADKLERLTAWWVQLWAESLGKSGKGSTPLRNIGPVDQHSQLQLHLAGPRDKFFTVMTTGTRGRGALFDAAHCKAAHLEVFASKTMGDLVAVQGKATLDTLARNGCPVRHIHSEKLDELALGYLLMHFMLETVIAADLMEVDPYDQPAVEEGKILAKSYMKALA